MIILAITVSNQVIIALVMRIKPQVVRAIWGFFMGSKQTIISGMKL